MNKSWLTFTHDEAMRWLGSGFGYNGVPVYEELAGPDGMRFTCIKIDGVTMDQMNEAARQIRQNRDVIGAIQWAEVVDD